MTHENHTATFTTHSPFFHHLKLKTIFQRWNISKCSNYFSSQPYGWPKYSKQLQPLRCFILTNGPKKPFGISNGPQLVSAFHGGSEASTWSPAAWSSRSWMKWPHAMPCCPSCWTPSSQVWKEIVLWLKGFCLIGLFCYLVVVFSWILMLTYVCYFL